jgi:hypothetical protein
MVRCESTRNGDIMKLRILEGLDSNGEKRYRVQRRYWWLFWATTTEAWPYCVYVHEYSTLQEAQCKMEQLYKERRKRRVVQKNIVCEGSVVGGDLTINTGRADT